jgi:DNA-binding NarL/FixJ family response regulator
MRILVADQNALLLAAIVRTFGRHCEVVVATRRDACLTFLEERKVDVVVACEKLRDYTGLELLSEVAGLSPETVRIFAARPETLKRLGARLDYFGLLGTLSYPIDARKLLVALKTARGKRATPPKPLKPKVQHVVLDESEWDTGERLGLLERELEAAGDGGGTLAGASAAAAEPAGGGEDGARAGAAGLASGGGDGGRVADVEHSAGRGGDGAMVRAVADLAGHGRGGAPAGAAEEPTDGGVLSETAGSKAPANLVEAAGSEGAAARDLQVVESAAWGANAVGPPVAVPRRTPGMTEDASYEVSFDEMPGAIAVAVVRREPKAATQGKSSRAAARMDKPRVMAAETSRHDALGAEAAPRPKAAKSAATKGAAAGDAAGIKGPTSGSEGSGTFEVACNDPDIDAPLPVETFGASNEPLFDRATGSSKAAASSSSDSNATASVGGAKADAAGSGTKATGSGGSAKGAASGGGKGAVSASDAKKSVPQGPKVRKPTVPTAAQREAFRRAVARRNAARPGGGFADGGGFGLGVGAPHAGDDALDALGVAVGNGGAHSAKADRGGSGDARRPEPFISTQSLSDLAKMAGKRQPLKVFNRTMAQPKRRAIVYGSGIAAAVLAAVVFQLMRATPSEQERHRHAQDVTAHLFSPPSSLDASSNSPPPQVFTPTPPHVDFPTPPSRGVGPQPQTFDPNTAPEDPPPPPAYQGPGPMEPPSMAHNGPPLEMQGPHVGD